MDEHLQHCYIIPSSDPGVASLRWQRCVDLGWITWLRCDPYHPTMTFQDGNNLDIWGFPWPWGYPKLAGWFLWTGKNPIVRNGWWWLGVPLWLRKPPYERTPLTAELPVEEDRLGPVPTCHGRRSLRISRSPGYPLMTNAHQKIGFNIPIYPCTDNRT